MCCVCREQKVKKDLIRIVKNKDGKIFVDESGKADGRGTYICRTGGCAGEAEKRRAIERALKSAVDAELFASIKELVAQQ
ncbi:MAG: YlxR family protein [Bacillota bacterium]|nr:YlxR family protein [Bacillota bacterium]